LQCWFPLPLRDFAHRTGHPCSDEMQIIVDRATTHSANFGLLKGLEKVRFAEWDAGKHRRKLLAELPGGVRGGDAESEAGADRLAASAIVNFVPWLRRGQTHHRSLGDGHDQG
jgi:hypothetical protein